MNSGPDTILLVEDDAPIRRFLRISLEAHHFRVLETRLGEEGLALCADHNPVLVVLDLGLPDIDGQTFISRLRSWSGVPLIVLSARSDEQQKVQALDAGADDYVTKPFGVAELMARIRALLRNRFESPAPAVFEVGELRVDPGRREVTLAGEPVHLSRKEYELLLLLISQPGKVLTHRQILTEIWGPAHVEDTHYLRVLVGHLRQKLGEDSSRPRHILTQQGVGYRLADG